MPLHASTDMSALALWTHWLDEPSASIALLATGGVYLLGVRRSWRRAGRGRGIRLWQAWSFGAGFAVLVVALMSPIDALADDLFAAHMLQHVLLAVVAPPLLVAGAPLVAGLWALSPGARGRVVRVLHGAPLLARSWRRLTAPSVASVVHAVAIWAWHVPMLYTLAVEHPAYHALEHLCFVGTAALLWWGILHPRRPRRASYGIGVLALFATMLQSGALGALLTLSHRAWFTVHAAGEARWGVTPLADQQIAGLIMWVPGGLLYLVAMSVLFLAWMRGIAMRGTEDILRGRPPIVAPMPE